MSLWVDYNGHVVMDLVPYVFWCTGNAAKCEF